MVVFKDNITVKSGVTLIILPGTTVKFASGKRLRVYGTLVAESTLNEFMPIASIRNNLYLSGIWVVHTMKKAIMEK